MAKPSRRAGTNGSAYKWLLFLYDETTPATNDDATRKAYRPVMTTIQDVRSRLIVAVKVEIGAPD